MLGMTIIYETMICLPHFNGFSREQKDGCMQPPIQNINGISI